MFPEEWRLTDQLVKFSIIPFQEYYPIEKEQKKASRVEVANIKNGKNTLWWQKMLLEVSLSSMWLNI